MPLSTNLFAIICQSLRVVGSPPDNVITFNPKSFNWSHTSRASDVFNSSGSASAQLEPQCLQRILQPIVISHTAVVNLFIYSLL